MTDDDDLLDMLRETAARLDPPPAPVLAAARAALSTRRLNEELAELVADSDVAAAGVVRAGSGEPRLLSFETATVSVELQVEHARAGVTVHGLVTGASGEAVVEAADGEHRAPIGPDGWFTVDGLPAGALRVRLRDDGGSSDGTTVTTGWVLV